MVITVLQRYTKDFSTSIGWYINIISAKEINLQNVKCCYCIFTVKFCQPHTVKKKKKLRKNLLKLVALNFYVGSTFLPFFYRQFYRFVFFSFFFYIFTSARHFFVLICKAIGHLRCQIDFLLEDIYDLELM